MKFLEIECPVAAGVSLVGGKGRTGGNGTQIESGGWVSGVKGCAFCGGLGHRIGSCPKLDAKNKKEMSNQERGGEMARYGSEY